MLGDIDDLLLRDAAERAQPVLRRGEAHHRIEGLGEDASRRPRHREFMHRQARGRLQHPGLLRVVGLRGRLVEKAFPGARLGGRTQGHAIAAIAAVGLQHQLLAMLPRIFQQIALAAMGQGGAPVADDPGPEHMAPEQAALLHAEQPLGDGGIGQQLPAALMVEIAGEGGDHAVLAEQQAHAVERLAQLVLQRQRDRESRNRDRRHRSGHRRRRPPRPSTLSSRGSAWTAMSPWRCDR